MKFSRLKQLKQKGFTLIELMVALAILAVLGVIAVPLYTSYVVSAKVAATQSNYNAVVNFTQMIALQCSRDKAGSYTITKAATGTEVKGAGDTAVGGADRRTVNFSCDPAMNNSKKIRGVTMLQSKSLADYASNIADNFTSPGLEERVNTSGMRNPYNTAKDGVVKKDCSSEGTSNPPIGEVEVCHVGGTNKLQISANIGSTSGEVSNNVIVDTSVIFTAWDNEGGVTNTQTDQP